MQFTLFTQCCHISTISCPQALRFLSAAGYDKGINCWDIYIICSTFWLGRVILKWEICCCCKITITAAKKHSIKFFGKTAVYWCEFKKYFNDYEAEPTISAIFYITISHLLLSSQNNVDSSILTYPIFFKIYNKTKLT